MDIGSALLALGASPLVVFAFAVVVDDIFGIALAVKTKTFSWAKLPSFLKSQFGTTEAMVVVGAAVAAYATGGDIKTAATTVVVAGGSALTVAVVKDIVLKIKAILFSGKAAPVAVKK